MAKSNATRWLVNLSVFAFFLSATIIIGLFASSADAASCRHHGATHMDGWGSSCILDEASGLTIIDHP